MASAEYMRRRRLDPAFRETERLRNAASRESRSRSADDRRYYERTRGRYDPEKSEFVGVDGEGGTDESGRHHYYLLRVGEDVLETGSPLTWQECLSFLADLPANRCYVGYFFDYDVSMICAGMPVDRLQALMDRSVRTSKYGHVYPMDVGPFQVDYIKRKYFKVRRRTPDGTPDRPWVEFSDVGPFFQQSFVKTLEEWNVCNYDELQAIIAGKDLRAEFGVMNDAIRDYNELEIELLVRLMNKFRATCQSIRVFPRRWQGPGEIASFLLGSHKIPTKGELPYWGNKTFCEFIDRSFYGGRFERSHVGHVAGPVYAPDINSAYPYALSLAPCLTHGRWEHSGPKPTSDLYVAEVSAEATSPVSYYGLPFRHDDGSVSFPGDIGVGVYWSFELDAAIHQRVEIMDSWSYHRECECTPFDWVPELYQERLKLKKDTQGKILKLALNSLYGKTAQRIGAAPYNNYVWGSFITAMTRTMLQMFIHSLPSCANGDCGANVYMLATDGIFTGELPPGFEASDKLGDWDLKVYPDGIFIVQPGLYFDNSREEQRLMKTRGAPTNLVLEYEGEFRRVFAEQVLPTQDFREHEVKLPMDSFCGIKVGLHRRKPELIGQWVDAPKKISFKWTGKRKSRVWVDGSALVTAPVDGSLLSISRPYDQQLAAKFSSARELDLPYSDGPGWDPGIGGIHDLT